MKFYVSAIGVLLFVAFILGIATKHVEHAGTAHRAVSYPAGGAWWVLLGVFIGLLAGANLHLLATRPWKWRVKVGAANYRSDVPVCVVRLFSRITVGSANAESDDFDEQLHQLVAEARQKAKALEVASR